jgi:hypothetical protein
MLRKLLIISLIFLPHAAFAQDEEEADRKIVYKQKTEIDFEGLEVEGVLQRPQSTLIIERRQASFNPLIKLRTDFNDKIEENTDEIK